MLRYALVSDSSALGMKCGFDAETLALASVAATGSGSQVNTYNMSLRALARQSAESRAAGWPWAGAASSGGFISTCTCSLRC